MFNNFKEEVLMRYSEQRHNELLKQADTERLARRCSSTATISSYFNFDFLREGMEKLGGFLIHFGTLMKTKQKPIL